jgi:hypothetical protein
LVGHVERKSFKDLSAVSIVWMWLLSDLVVMLETSLALAMLWRDVQLEDRREAAYDSVEATIHGDESENAAESPAKAYAPASNEERMAGGIVR